MNNISLNTISSLNNIIEELPRWSNISDLLCNPKSDFTRKSKFGLIETVRFILSVGPTTLKNELRSFFDNSVNSITASALVQSRSKIKPELFSSIFYEFNKRNPYSIRFKGFNLIAVDGSKLNIPYNPKDALSTHRGRQRDNGNPGRGYNQLHLSTAFDILNDRYIDAVIKDITQYNERHALLEMVRRYGNKNSISIIDRGYEQANLIEHLKQSTFFVMRVKDVGSGNGIITNFHLPHSEFDIDYSFTFTNYNRKEYQQQRDKFKIIQKYQEFDFLNEDTHFYDTTWRIVRFKVEDSYEVIITNLDRDLFNIEDIKNLYGLRWNTEIAFRYLKHSVNLTNFISRKKVFLHQEIWAKLIMYNLSSIITLQLEAKRENKKKKKHFHMINFDNAIHAITSAFKFFKRKGGVPPNLDSQISNETSPVREGRKFARSPHPQTYCASNYRSY